MSDIDTTAEDKALPARTRPRRAPAVAWARWRRVRQGVQLLSFILFIYLLFAALPGRAAFPLADLFFRLDALAALGGMLAARAWIIRLVPALIIVALTLFLGRVWCGWLCPMGTLLDWCALPGAEERAAAISPRWRLAKYLLLLVIVAGALFGSLTLLALDPLAILSRTMTTAVLPALNKAVTAVETALYPVHALRPGLDWLEATVRGPILPAKPGAFSQGALFAALLVGIIALNALAARFWCRYLCPLGALLGFLSRVSLLRPLLGPACNRCGRCAGACPLGAIDTEDGYTPMTGECTVCLDCLARCPATGTGLGLRRRAEASQPFDPTRRQLLGSLAVGAAGVALLRTGTHTVSPDPFLLRPPGATDEEAFLARCLRCGQCLRVCPTDGLQPALFEAGLEGVWTPHLVPRLGNCDYGCNACGQVCPSGAIPALSLEVKQQVVMGLAAVDRNRCLPWAYGVPCIVCEEMCPVPEKAIKLEEVTVTDAEGNSITLQQPVVRQDLCTGCGICENRCPMGGQAAIRVYQPQVL